VERITAPLPPYSDFNFVSLWCWDTDGQCRLSRLGDNLVIQLKDYLTDQLIVSFLGTDSVPETSTALLEYVARRRMKPELRLVPEVSINACDLSDRVSVSEEVGSFDYVLSIDEWVALSGGRFRNKRNVIHRIERMHSVEFRLVDLSDRRTREEVVQLFLLWSDKRRRLGFDETRNELLAIRRSFQFGADPDIVSFGVFTDGILRGFSINQLLPNGYAIGHFWKADPSLTGVYAYLLHHTSRFLFERGYRYFNIEQDLGKSGLAKSKSLFRPHHLLKKYVITWSNGAMSGVPGPDAKSLLQDHREAT
jgi:hypothetical protein